MTSNIKNWNLLYFPIFPLYIWILMVDFSRFFWTIHSFNSCFFVLPYWFMIRTIFQNVHAKNTYIKRFIVLYCCWKVFTRSTASKQQERTSALMMKIMFGIWMCEEITFLVESEMNGIVLFMCCHLLLITRFTLDIWHLYQPPRTKNHLLETTETTTTTTSNNSITLKNDSNIQEPPLIMDVAQDVSQKTSYHAMTPTRLFIWIIHSSTRSNRWWCLFICLFLFFFMAFLNQFFYAPLMYSSELLNSSSLTLLGGMKLYSFLLSCSVSLSVIYYFIIHDMKKNSTTTTTTSESSASPSLYTMMGMIFLYVCDICVGFDLVLKKDSIAWLWANSFIWVFYVPSLICLTESCCHRADNFEGRPSAG